MVRQQETGSLERSAIPGRPREISREQEAILLARLQAAPDDTVLEHCAWWAEHQGQDLSEATMWRAMRRLGWTHKKSHWQPASATRRRGRPGERRSPSWILSNSSLSMKAAHTPL
jgi:transposase